MIKSIEVSMIGADCRMIGYSDYHRETVITSPVVSFDEEAMVAVTRSGSNYKVSFHTGFDHTESLEKLRAKATVS